MSSPPDLAPIFQRSRDGDRTAESELYTLLYQELRAIAGRLMHRQAPDHMLQPTALLNEACIRLLARRTPGWNDQNHLLRTAALAMRHILVDHRRGTVAASRQAPKGERIPIERIVVRYEQASGDLLTIDAALKQLEADDPRGAELIQLCFFGGHTFEKAAEIMGVTSRQAFRWWAAARVQLKDFLDHA